jgi:hypothetical protein
MKIKTLIIQLQLTSTQTTTTTSTKKIYFFSLKQIEIKKKFAKKNLKNKDE